MNLASAELLRELFGLRLKTVHASELAVHGKGSDPILNLCRAVGATIYLSGAEGRNYLDEAAFAAARVRLIYQDYCHPEYAQLHGPYMSHMAAVDLLLNCGPDSREIMLSGQVEIA